MQAGLILINQWLPLWGSPHRDLYDLSFRMMAECPGCGHSEIQVVTVFFGVGIGVVIKWNDPDRHSKQESELKPSTNAA